MGRIVDENYEPVYCDALEDEHEYVGKKLDLVEVVRCKDCKYADVFHHCDRVKFWTSGNDFCSRGERREDG